MTREEGWETERNDLEAKDEKEKDNWYNQRQKKKGTHLVGKKFKKGAQIDQIT